MLNSKDSLPLTMNFLYQNLSGNIKYNNFNKCWLKCITKNNMKSIYNYVVYMLNIYVYRNIHRTLSSYFYLEFEELHIKWRNLKACFVFSERGNKNNIIFYIQYSHIKRIRSFYFINKLTIYITFSKKIKLGGTIIFTRSLALKCKLI